MKEIDDFKICVTGYSGGNHQQHHTDKTEVRPSNYKEGDRESVVYLTLISNIILLLGDRFAERNIYIYIYIYIYRERERERENE